MAAASPASSGKASDSTSAAAVPAVVNSNGTPQKPGGFDMPKPNLRGLNKPKCIQCGNVARSRCPFQCCKSCCYNAKNPCHIHVLKQNNTLPDKPPPSASPLVEQPSSDSPSTGASWRVGSLRQLPHNFLSSLRTKKPITKKDVMNTNKWRFMKLREHMQGDIEVENEAFERYTQNIRLLEETFAVTGDSIVQPTVEAASLEDRMEMLVSEAKVRLKSNSAKEDSFKERIGNIMDQKLKKLQERENAYNDDGPSNQNLDDNMKSVKLVVKQRMAKVTAIKELLDKLRRVQSEDDLKPCLDMRADLFGQENGSPLESSNKLNHKESLSGNPESNVTPTPCYPFPKLWTRMDDEDTLSKINSEFSSLSQIAQL